MDTDPRLLVAAAVAVVGFLGWLIAVTARLSRLRTSLRCEECHAPVTLRDDTDRAAWARCEAAGVVRCTQHAPADRKTNPNCAARGHVLTRIGDGTQWKCVRPLCGETWGSPPTAIRNRKPYDQERSAS